MALPKATRSWPRIPTGSASVWGSMVWIISPAKPCRASGPRVGQGAGGGIGSDSISSPDSSLASTEGLRTNELNELIGSGPPLLLSVNRYPRGLSNGLELASSHLCLSSTSDHGGRQRGL